MDRANGTASCVACISRIWWAAEKKVDEMPCWSFAIDLSQAVHRACRFVWDGDFYLHAPAFAGILVYAKFEEKNGVRRKTKTQFPFATHIHTSNPIVEKPNLTHADHFFLSTRQSARETRREWNTNYRKIECSQWDWNAFQHTERIEASSEKKELN